MLVVHGEVFAQIHGVVIFHGQQQHGAFDQGQEVGGGVVQGVFHGVLVQGLDTHHLVELGNHVVTVLIGDQAAVDVIQGPVVVIQSVDQVADHTQGISAVEGVADVTDTVYKVLSGDSLAGVSAGMIHPVDAFTDLEGPDGLILVDLPAFSQRGNIDAVDVGFHQTVDTVGNDASDGGVSGGEIVEGCIRRTEGSLIGLEIFLFFDDLLSVALNLLGVGRGRRRVRCLRLLGLGLTAAGGQRQHHDHSQQQCEIALHIGFLLNIKIIFFVCGEPFPKKGKAPYLFIIIEFFTKCRKKLSGFLAKL